ncbi:hypothetical protein Tco_0638460, partial [Tanacetum coccineum]
QSVWLDLQEYLDLPKMLVPPHLEFYHVLELVPATLSPLRFSALFRHVSFPFAVVTNISPLFPRIASTFSWSVGPCGTHSKRADRNDIIWLMASMGSSPCLNTRIVRPKSSGGNSEVLMVDWLSIVETEKVIYTVEIEVEIESFGMSSNEFDKETGSSDGLQPKQEDLSCVHALNELHLHEIHVVTSKHKVD